MDFVIDASVALSWAFEDEETGETEAVLNRMIQGEQAVVPHLWLWEIANALTFAVRKKRIDSGRRRQFLSTMGKAPLILDRATPAAVFGRIVELADDHHLTVYDAAYLELAIRHGLPLATLDQALIRAARKAKIALLLE